MDAYKCRQTDAYMPESWWGHTGALRGAFLFNGSDKLVWENGTNGVPHTIMM